MNDLTAAEQRSAAPGSRDFEKLAVRLTQIENASSGVMRGISADLERLEAQLERKPPTQAESTAVRRELEMAAKLSREMLAQYASRSAGIIATLRKRLGPR